MCVGFTGGVPYVWNDSMVLSPQAWPFLRSSSVHTMGFQSGARIRRAPRRPIQNRRTLTKFRGARRNLSHVIACLLRELVYAYRTAIELGAYFELSAHRLNDAAQRAEIDIRPAFEL